MSVRGWLAPLSNAETGVALSTSLAGGSVARPGDPPSLAQLAAADAAALRRKMSEKKRQWRQTRPEEQLLAIRERETKYKRSVRDKRTPEQRRIEREKDARRKALKRQLDKERRQNAAAMSISRLLNKK